MSNQFYLVAVALTTIVSVSRITRLLTFDKFPPIKYFRDKYEEKTENSGWDWLTMCGYCMAPWVALVVLVWGQAVGVYSAETPDETLGTFIWWGFNGWMAVAYLAAILMANDGDENEG